MSASKERFFQAIERVFKRWPALVMVVDNCFGGANSVEKAEWMIQVTGEYMCDFWPVSAEEVEEYIGTMMDQEFDTILEDGSLAQVAKQLCDLKQLCWESLPDAVEDYLARIPTPKSGKPDMATALEEVDPSECIVPVVDPSECVEPMKSLQLECQDGDKDHNVVMDNEWTVVTKRKHK